MKTRLYNTRSSSSNSSLKSRKREENTSDQTIPFDLVIEILTRVPAKSIARFRCLSKLYASTLRTPNFTDSFFTISSSRPRLLFTVLKNGKTFFFSSPQPQNPSLITTDFHLSFPINSPSEVSRPVNGLVCGLNQRTTKAGIVTTPLICNPNTGQFLTLPRVKTRRRGVISYLGYDPSEKQFKILCMTMLYSFSEEHQVLTLETGKKPSWRMIKCDIPHVPDSVDFRDRHNVYDGICMNGVFYYLALVSSKESYNGFPDIVCFDIKSENFSFIKRAHEGMNIHIGGNFGSTLVNYKGKLAKLQPNIDWTNLVFTGIQLVLEDAEKHEWSSQIYVFPHPWKDIIAKTNLCFVGTTCRGEIVLSLNYLSDSFYLLYYNPETKTITKVGIQGMEDF